MSNIDTQLETILVDSYGYTNLEHTKAAINELINEARIEELQLLKRNGHAYGWGETFAIDLKVIETRINRLTKRGKE